MILPLLATFLFSADLKSTRLKMAALIAVLVRAGLCALSSAANPETCGAAMEVPLKKA